MAMNTNMQIKLVERQPDQSEKVLSQFTGDLELRNESAFYLPGTSGKWTKYLKLQTAMRAKQNNMELVIFVEPAGIKLVSRFKRYLSGMSDDAVANVFLLLGFGIVGLGVAIALFTNSILGFMVQYSGMVLGLATMLYIGVRAALAGWPPLFGTTPAVFAGFAVGIAVYWGFDFVLEPEGGLGAVPREELGQAMRDQIGALPALALSYSSTILVALRGVGFVLTADIAATLLPKDEDS